MSAHPQLYVTAPSPCPYLPGRTERKIFTHLVGEMAQQTHEDLMLGGFRRSQHIAYKPACERCRACVPTRVLTDTFQASRSQRRVWRRNRDLIGNAVENIPTSEQYSLFQRYVDMRHQEGGMADMGVLDYAMMVEDSHVNTKLVEYRRRGVDTGITGRGESDLVAVVLYDEVSTGLSMVYSFFDPDLKRRSLGTFIILDFIERARRAGLPYCHLGYWVAGSPKMEYKSNFLPQERLIAGEWQRVDAPSR